LILAEVDFGRCQMKLVLIKNQPRFMPWLVFDFGTTGGGGNTMCEVERLIFNNRNNRFSTITLQNVRFWDSGRWRKHQQI